jgi:hypothetical protein
MNVPRLVSVPAFTAVIWKPNFGKIDVELLKPRIRKVYTAPGTKYDGDAPLASITIIVSVISVEGVVPWHVGPPQPPGPMTPVQSSDAAVPGPMLCDERTTYRKPQIRVTRNRFFFIGVLRCVV